MDKRITKDKGILQGTAIIKGTRISVSIILDKMVAGNGDKKYVQKIYPQLKQDDINAALSYASDNLKDKK